MDQNRILDWVPTGVELREVQRQVLLQVEEQWDSSDVFVITVPTAGGKSLLSKIIAEWAGNSSIIVPNNVLLDQHESMFPDSAILRRRGEYPCNSFPHQTCDDTHRKLGRCCEAELCPYTKAVDKAKNSWCSVSNYWTYLVHKLYKPTLICDEAHLLIDMLKELATRKIWKHQYQWPSNMKDIGDLLEWLEWYPFAQTKTLKKLKKEIERYDQCMIVYKTSDFFRGEEQELLKLVPLETKHEPPLLWPGHKIRKIVLMSATIAKPDIVSLGLSKRRVCYIETPSPIPKENRPILQEKVGNFSYKHQQENLPYLVDYIRTKLEEYPDKGLIHAPYSLAVKLKEQLANEPRLMWHNRENKREQLEEFIDNEDDAVLVGSGFYEGLDLPYESGRWQVICKVPYPSLSDRAIKRKLEVDPEWYAWQAIKAILQASGRICRTEDDYGVTHIIDSSFSGLFKRHSSLFPNWWTEAVLTVDK